MAADAVAQGVGSVGLAIVLPVLIAYFAIILVGFLVIHAFLSAILFSIARRIRTDSQWMAWVPLLNVYYISRMAGAPAWTVLTVLPMLIHLVLGIPFFVAWVYWWRHIAVRCGKPAVLGVLMLVPFLNVLIAGYLAWG